MTIFTAVHWHFSNGQKPAVKVANCDPGASGCFNHHKYEPCTMYPMPKLWSRDCRGGLMVITSRMSPKSVFLRCCNFKLSLNKGLLVHTSMNQDTRYQNSWEGKWDSQKPILKFPIFLLAQECIPRNNKHYEELCQEMFYMLIYKFHHSWPLARLSRTNGK